MIFNEYFGDEKQLFKSINNGSLLNCLIFILFSIEKQIEKLNDT